jgi:hypothetical protein
MVTMAPPPSWLQWVNEIARKNVTLTFAEKCNSKQRALRIFFIVSKFKGSS